MAIPDTGSENSIYTQGRRLAENGSAITDKIDQGADKIKSAAGSVIGAGKTFSDVMAWIVKNWQIVLIGAVAFLLIWKRL